MKSILTPRFFAADIGLWKSPQCTTVEEEGKESLHEYEYEYEYPSLEFKSPWKTSKATPPPPPITSTTACSSSRRLSLESPWLLASKVSAEPPTVVSYWTDWCDDVSLLNDNPDDDDLGLLPHSTCNVLAPLLDVMYKDESEVDYEEHDDLERQDAYNQDDWNEAEVLE